MTAIWLTMVALSLLLVALNPSDQTTRQAGLTAHLLTKDIARSPKVAGNNITILKKQLWQVKYEFMLNPKNGQH